MSKEKEFLVLRYSIVEEAQESLAVRPLPGLKGEAVLESIRNAAQFSRSGTNYSFVGFEPIGSTTYLGKLAKQRKAHLGRKTETDVVDQEEEDWVASIVVIDVADQYILASKNWRIGSPDQLIRAIEDGLSPRTLALYNHKVFVRGVVKRDAFWRAIGTNRKLYRLRLKLVSPNILETDLVAREAIEALKNIFNQDETTIELKNDSGALQIPQFIASYIDYIDNGEGAWRLVTEGDLFGKKSFTSNENIETVSLPMEYANSDDANPEQTDLLGNDWKSENVSRLILSDVLQDLKERRKIEK